MIISVLWAWEGIVACSSGETGHSATTSKAILLVVCCAKENADIEVIVVFAVEARRVDII